MLEHVPNIFVQEFKSPDTRGDEQNGLDEFEGSNETHEMVMRGLHSEVM